MTHEMITQARRTAQAARNLGRVPALLSAIQDHQSGLRAQTFEASNRQPTLYCVRHECDLTDCHRADRLCTGTPIEDRSDPTGEAAIRADRARQDERQALAMLRRATNELDALAAMITAYLDAKPVTLADDENLERCQSCARIPAEKNGKRGTPRMWGPVDHTSDCKGNLPEPKRLCNWCYRFVIDMGVLPTRAQLESHHRTGKTTRKAS